MKLTGNYADDVAVIGGMLGVGRSFDAIARHLKSGGDDVTFFYIDGFIENML